MYNLFTCLHVINPLLSQYKASIRSDFSLLNLRET